MKIDNEFKTIIPPLSDDERCELEKSILAEGCRDALVLWGDALVDGHNRYEICREYGIPYRTVRIELDSREDAINWIIQNQLARRNLTDVQRCRLALKSKVGFALLAKERQKEAGGKKGNQHTGGISKEVALVPNLAQAPNRRTRDVVAYNNRSNIQ